MHAEKAPLQLTTLRINLPFFPAAAIHVVRYQTPSPRSCTIMTFFNAFLPPSQLPRLKRPSPHQTCAKNPPVASLHPTRRQLLSTAVSISLTTVLPFPIHAEPSETNRIFLDISVAGKPRGRIVISLYGNDAPTSVDTLVKLVQGNLRNRAGRTAGYKYSQGTKVVAGKRVQLGTIKQVDIANQQPGVPQRQMVTVEVPENRDSNSLSHNAPGIVSVRRGGSFEFCLLLAEDLTLDESNLVVGRVVDGMNIVNDLGKVPTNRKTIRDGYRSVGKAIGDPRAKIDVSCATFEHPDCFSCSNLTCCFGSNHHRVAECSWKTK